jgi:hypothetical protein
MDFDLVVLGSIAAGSVIFWSVKGKKRLRPFAIPAITTFVPRGRWRNLAELMIFVLLGCVVSFILVSPATARQGFAAGLGWTGLLTEKIGEDES